MFYDDKLGDFIAPLLVRYSCGLIGLSKLESQQGMSLVYFWNAAFCGNIGMRITGDIT
jgi:hypothetical protein